MEAVTCRLLPLASAGGAWNMAADEVLLESAMQGIRSLRFYTWDKPTLSLGYFQHVRQRCDDSRLMSLPFVRRASGGAALVHHLELTYALSVPLSDPSQHAHRSAQSWLARMHQVIAAALATLAVQTTSAPGKHACGPGPFLCFQCVAAGDLLIDGHKVVGSAQRRSHAALIQHGAILLGTSPFTPQLPGITQLAGPILSPTDLRAAIVRQLGRYWSWSFTDNDWSSDERSRIDELMQMKYETASWNEKR